MKRIRISIVAMAALFLLAISAVPGSFSNPPLPIPQVGAANLPSLVLRLKKRVFLQHEPIGLAVAVVNDTVNDIQLWDDAPAFSRLDYQGQSLFSPAPAGYGPRTLPVPDPRAKNIGERANDDRYWISSWRIARSERWQRTIYLQQFTGPLKPGRYDVTYDLGASYALAPAELMLNGFRRFMGDNYIVTEGKLSFQVKPATPEQVEAMIRACASGDRAEAKTTLCLIDDPRVIPYLVQRIGLTCWENGIAGALEQFRADKRTKPLLLANLASSNPGAVGPTIDLLAYLKYDIGKEQLDRLLKSQDENVSQAVHRYIKIMDTYHQELN